MTLVDEENLRENGSHGRGIDEGEERRVAFRDLFHVVDAVVELEQRTGRFEDDAPGLLAEGVAEIHRKERHASGGVRQFLGDEEVVGDGEDPLILHDLHAKADEARAIDVREPAIGGRRERLDRSAVETHEGRPVVGLDKHPRRRHDVESFEVQLRIEEQRACVVTAQGHAHIAARDLHALSEVQFPQHRWRRPRAR